MRLVRRGQRAPWSHKTVWTTGAPRVAKSNIHFPVTMNTPSGPETVGYIDLVHHLYQHHGLENYAPIADGHILYSTREWEVVCEKAQWIEYYDDRREVVYRISADRARSLVVRKKNFMAIPIDAYTKEIQRNGN